MPFTNDGIQSFPASQILIGEIECKEKDNVLTPFRRCTVICTNGGIWDVDCLAFSLSGSITEEGVLALWDSEPQHFRKREQVGLENNLK